MNVPLYQRHDPPEIASPGPHRTGVPGGAIVGADFAEAENVPDELPAGSKFKVEAYGIVVTAEPASAEVTSYVEPAR